MPAWRRTAVPGLLLALLTAACGSGTSSGGSTATTSGSPSSAEGATLTIYNAQHEELVQPVVDGFTAKTGIDVSLRSGEDAELGNQIVAEGAASPADVFLTENSPAMTLVDDAGLFAPLDAATLKQVPAAYRPADGHWTGFAARSTVLAYDPRALKKTKADIPASITDLADPAWQGRIGIAPGGADFQAIVSAVLQMKGEAATEQWLQGLRANAKLYQGNSAVMKAVNSGEIDAGVVYHYYWFKDRLESGANSKNVALAYFGKQDPGAFVSVSGAGVLASSKHAAQAQQFVQYLTSAEGQKALVASNAMEYAVASGVASSPSLVPLSRLQAPPVPVGELDGPKVVDLMQQAGLL